MINQLPHLMAPVVWYLCINSVLHTIAECLSGRAVSHDCQAVRVVKDACNYAEEEILFKVKKKKNEYGYNCKLWFININVLNVIHNCAYVKEPVN